MRTSGLSEHVGEADILLSPVPGSSLEERDPPHSELVDKPQDQQRVSPVGDQSGPGDGSFSSALGIGASQKALCFPVGDFRAPSVRVSFNNLLVRSFAISVEECGIRVFATGITNQDHGERFVAGRTVPDSVELKHCHDGLFPVKASPDPFPLDAGMREEGGQRNHPCTLLPWAALGLGLLGHHQIVQRSVPGQLTGDMNAFVSPLEQLLV